MSARLVVLSLSLVLGLALTGCSSSSGAATISSWSPMSGPVGTTVTVFGSGLQGNRSSVTVNGVAAKDVSGDTRSIMFTIPAGATTGPLVVDGVTVGTFTVTS